MRTRLLRIREISKEDENAWRRLGTRSIEPNPFAEPDFFQPAAVHFPGYADAQLVVVEDGSEFLAALPIACFDRPRLPPRPMANTISQPTMVTALQTPLIDRASPAAAVDALVAGLQDAAKSHGWPGVVHFDWIGTDGPVGETLRGVCRTRGCPVFVREKWTRAVLTRSGQWANPAEGKKKRELARKQRVLSREAGGEVTLVDRTRDPKACDDLLRLEVSGWKARQGGLAIALVPEKEAWFREVHRRLVEADNAILHSFDVNATPVAMHYWVRAGEGIFCFRLAFDEAFRRYSPGLLLLFASLVDLYENTDAAFIDSATHEGNDFFLTAMRERREISRMYVGTGGAVDKAAVRTLPAMRRLVAAGNDVSARLRHRSQPADRSPPAEPSDANATDQDSEP